MFEVELLIALGEVSFFCDGSIFRRFVVGVEGGASSGAGGLRCCFFVMSARRVSALGLCVDVWGGVFFLCSVRASRVGSDVWDGGIASVL